MYLLRDSDCPSGSAPQLVHRMDYEVLQIACANLFPRWGVVIVVLNIGRMKFFYVYVGD